MAPAFRKVINPAAGGGTFSPKVDCPVAGQTQDLAAGDFSGDGKKDLMVTINTQQFSLSLLTGNGSYLFFPSIRARLNRRMRQSV